MSLTNACHSTTAPGHYEGMTTERPLESEFRLLYQRTSTRVFGYVRRYCEPADCDDIVAEVYLVAWRRFGELPDEPLAWLIGTARNVMGQHWRSSLRRRRLAAKAQGFREVAGPDTASEAVDRVAMLEALAALSAEDREILLLTGWDGFDAAGAAEVLQISASAARTRLSRARRRLVAQFDAGVPAPGVQPSLNLGGT